MRYKIKERKEQWKLIRPDGRANSAVSHLSLEVTAVSQLTVRTLRISLTHSGTCDAKLSKCSKIALIISLLCFWCTEIDMEVRKLSDYFAKFPAEDHIHKIHLAWQAVFISHANTVLPPGDI